MTWRDEFPNFDAGDECETLLAAGFEDLSWGNDACPSFGLADTVTWVDYRDPQLRKWAEPNEPRLTVVRATWDYEIEPQSIDCETISDVLLAVETLSKERA